MGARRYAIQVCFRFGGFRSGRCVVVHDAPQVLHEKLVR